MFGVCTSIFGGMTENQLAEVKVHGQGRCQCLYEMLCNYQKDFPESETGKAIAALQENLQKWQLFPTGYLLLPQKRTDELHYFMPVSCLLQ